MVKRQQSVNCYCYAQNTNPPHIYHKPTASSPVGAEEPPLMPSTHGRCRLTATRLPGKRARPLPDSHSESGPPPHGESQAPAAGPNQQLPQPRRVRARSRQPASRPPFRPPTATQDGRVQPGPAAPAARRARSAFTHPLSEPARPPAAPGPFKWAKLWRRRRRRSLPSPRQAGARQQTRVRSREGRRGGTGAWDPGRGGARAGDSGLLAAPRRREGGPAGGGGAGPPQGARAQVAPRPVEPQGPGAAALRTSIRGR